MVSDKQIEEMAKYCCFPCEMEHNGKCIENNDPCKCYIANETAKALYNAGYRKASDVAMEIFEEIKTAFARVGVLPHNVWLVDFNVIAEIKKKYESEGADDGLE